MIQPPARTVPRPRERTGFATFLSALLPGLGQLYQDRWVRGVLMLLLPPLILLLALGFVLIAAPVTELVIRGAQLVAVLLVGTLFAYHAAVVIDAFAGRAGALLSHRPAEYAVLAAVMLGLGLAYLPVYEQSRAWAGVVTSVFELPDRTVDVGTPSAETTAPGWSERERLNVLILGVDTREELAETHNTDTVIVLSLDPVSETAAMLSIPRDTLVEIPGVGADKVNSAYAHGGTGSRGAELARRTVERFLGIEVHSYALIDFVAFRSTIDSVGGVIVDVRRPLRDEHYPTEDFGVERLRFLAGPQHMDGEQALKYARSRHDSNDFSRARRQQAVIFALRESLARAGIFRMPGIVEEVGPLVRTTFDPGDVLRLARTALAVDVGQIRSEVLLPCGGDEPHCELTEENTPSGYYLIPDADKVRALVADLFEEAAGSRTP
ncbi:MAG: LCP family protein [Candidatus Limnocylindria bacterium]